MIIAFQRVRQVISILHPQHIEKLRQKEIKCPEKTKFEEDIVSFGKHFGNHYTVFTTKEIRR